MGLEGKKVVVTGTFEGYSTEQLRASLTSQGAVVADDVRPDVELVFVGEDAGGEYELALELGIPLRDEAALKALLAGENDPGTRPSVPSALQEPALAVPLPELEPPDLDAPPAGPARGEETAEADGGEAGERVFDKGARVRIVGGLEGVGAVGEIFWWGESKYGEGMRAGVRAEDGETYWVDEENLGWPEDEVPEEVVAVAREANQFSRGDEVRVVDGKHAGAQGTIFWWGESKWGPGMRAGVETSSGEKVWVDAEELEALDTGDDDDIPF